MQNLDSQRQIFISCAERLHRAGELGETAPLDCRGSLWSPWSASMPSIT